MTHIIDNRKREFDSLPDGYVKIKRKLWSRGLYNAMEEFLNAEYLEKLPHIYILDMPTSRYVIFPPWKYKREKTFLRYKMLTV